MVAPKTTHSGTGATCDVETYKRYLWCRVELLSHYFRRGRNAMYLMERNMSATQIMLETSTCQQCILPCRLFCHHMHLIVLRVLARILEMVYLTASQCMKVTHCVIL